MVLKSSQFCYTRLSFYDVIDITSFLTEDKRGNIRKTYSCEQFLEFGINFIPVEETFLTSRAGVLRGLHFQKQLKQSKLITCISGTAQLIIIGIDKDRVDFGKWISINLYPGRVIFIPGSYAIGTLSLEDLLLHIGYGEKYNPELSSGIRWNDPDLSIEWIMNKNPNISENDLKLQSFSDYKKTLEDERKY